MSTNQNIVVLFSVLFMLFSAGPVSANPARLNLVIRLEEGSHRLQVSGRFGDTQNLVQKDLSIIDSYADAVGLAKRVSSLQVFGTEGGELALKRFNNGEYTVAEPIAGFRYDFDAGLPEPLIAAPHITWLGDGRALLKLQDLVPELNADSYRIEFELPLEWGISSNETSLAPNEFETTDLRNAVFLAGKGIRNQSFEYSGTRITISVLDQWQFEDSEVASMSKEILNKYKELFGSMPRTGIHINLAGFPAEMENGRWRAETQGGTVTIVSAPVNYRNLAPQRLHEQLRHELFHLWIPEALNLEGDYAWFYEGFARYQALKAGVWVGRLRFEDFLISMSEAINIASLDTSGLSTNGVSGSQWVRGPGVIAAKGMSVAFLADSLLLAESKGKRDVSEILKTIFRAHSGNAEAVDGQRVVETELLKYPILEGVVKQQIRSGTEVDWKSVVAPLGIEATTRSGRTVLDLADKPNRKQKALLNKLGYNRWKIFLPG